jgi:7-cyano-7-deazaguanine synthase
MCAIFGAFAIGDRPLDTARLEAIRERARDRGRDGGRLVFWYGDTWTAALGAWRATPTTETRVAPPQPHDGIVHNGTIANDAELGNAPGEVDSLVLPKVLDRSSLTALTDSLARIRGSYALAVLGADRVFLAANYKPIHYAHLDHVTYFASMERHLAPEMPWGTRPARLPPYSALDLRTGALVRLPREQTGRTLVIASSGLDSTTVAYMLRAQGERVALLHFRYGCKAETREHTAIRAIAADLGADVVTLPLDYSRSAGTSPLLTDAQIAPGLRGAEYAHEWVPARNLLMIATAVAYAEANGFDAVALGNNLEEAGAYPDNEEEFTNLLDQALDYAVHDGGRVRLIAPVGHLMKHEIVATGLGLGVPYHLTWSCYRGGERHCGQCGPCTMRKLAFERNGRTDPVFLADAA